MGFFTQKIEAGAGCYYNSMKDYELFVNNYDRGEFLGKAIRKLYITRQLKKDKLRELCNWSSVLSYFTDQSTRFAIENTPLPKIPHNKEYTEDYINEDWSNVMKLAEQHKGYWIGVEKSRKEMREKSIERRKLSPQEHAELWKRAIQELSPLPPFFKK